MKMEKNLVKMEKMEKMEKILAILEKILVTILVLYIQRELTGAYKEWACLRCW